MSRSKVEVQKGRIDSNPPTMKTMSVRERDVRDAADRALRRKAQTLDFVEPRSGRK